MAAERHCDHNALTLTARKGMGIAAVDGLGIGQSDLSEHFDCAGFRLFAGHVFFVDADRFAHLTADTGNGV